MIDTDTLRDLQNQVDTRNHEAKTSVEAFLDAPPGRDLKLAAPMWTALTLAEDAGRTLRRALDPRQRAGGTCEECQQSEHDTCPIVAGCPCCADSMRETV